jgi:hypothetical protein|eukprot:Stramenopile-MAST_4_protein_3922
MSSRRRELFSLYRRAIRIARSFPHVPENTRRKFLFNVHWAFRTHRDETDAVAAAAYLAEGALAVAEFEALSQLPAETIEAFSRKPSG